MADTGERRQMLDAADNPASAPSTNDSPLTPYYDPVTGRQLRQDEVFDETGSTIRDSVAVVRDDGSIIVVKPNSEGTDYTEADTAATRLLYSSSASGGSTRTAAQDAADQAQANYYNAEAGGVAEKNAIARDQLAQTAAANAAQLALDREKLAEQKRASLLDAARSMLETQMGVREKAREQQLGLAGTDPFRFLASVHQQSVGPTTQTPYDTFKSQLSGIANEQLPQIGPNSTVADLESGVQKLQDMATANQDLGQNPWVGGVAGQSGGMAMGGQVGQSGRGNAGYGIPVGENGPEIMHVRPDGSVEVIPMVRGAATGFDPNSMTVLPGLFSGLRSDITTGGDVAGRYNTQDVLPYQTASELGYFQRAPGSLIKASGQDPIYEVDAGGQLRQFSGPQQFESGHSYGDVQEVSPDQLSRFQQGGQADGYQLPTPHFGQRGALAQPLSLYRGMIEANVAPAEAKRISDAIGILPAPHVAAKYLRNLLPTEQEAILKAYSLAGIPEADFKEMISPAAIAGPGRQSLSYA